MTAGRLLLLRHGQTSWNATGRFQGQADIGLDETGESQAEQAALRLQDEGITRLHCSDLSRARQTAAAVEAVTGLSAVVDDQLREISVGSWEGLTLPDVLALEPDYLEREGRGEDVRRSPTGETLGEVADRMVLALVAITEAAGAGDTVLVVGHGLALRVGMAAFLGIDLHGARRFAGLRNCHWSTLTRVHQEWRIDGYNVGAGTSNLSGLVG